jgi:DNA-binding SARP family transcriptional activator
MIHTPGVDGDRPVDAGVAHLTLFGCFALMVDAARVDLRTSSQRLVAYLGLHGPSPRIHVSGTLWPDVDDRHAQASLRTALWRIPRSCPNLIYTRGPEIRLDQRVTVDSDNLIQDIHQLLHGDHTNDPQMPQLPPDATLLPGWYDDWVLTARERLRQLHLQALEILAESQLAHGEHAKALETALTIVDLEPLRERAHRTIIRVHLETGNHAEAIHTYTTFCDRLSTEMHIPPSPKMTSIINSIREPEPPWKNWSLADGAGGLLGNSRSSPECRALG